MEQLSDRVVTFLLTDVEGSTRLWEEAPDSMMEALRLHDNVIDAAARSNNGTLVRPRGEGDSRFVVFRSAFDAVAGAAQMQRSLTGTAWPTPRPLKVRAALHTGAAELEMGDYYGSAVNRTARLRSIAHGGQTVLSGATHELIADRMPAGVTAVDMGLHRLKDLTRPEHVYQMNVDALESSFPPLESLDAIPNNLPIQLTEFVGRESDLETAQSTLDRARLLTILAPGGAGKTRLAIQIAAEAASGHPDGAFFVDLSTTESPDGIIQKIAESLAIALSTEADLESQLLAYLAGKRQLLVLDNFEHLVSGASLVTDILTNTREVKLIVTSRAKLNVVGETVQTISGLETRWSTPEEALGVSGVQLFLSAAKRADASFQLASDDLRPLAEILRTVGGMPLGIELAAAWVDVLPVTEIATEISKSLDFLESEAGHVPDRHRSIRAVFDYSWTMLGAEERQTFCALSVFRGGFTREAAEAVTTASIRSLANLTSKSLLVLDRASGRYTVHELLRQYAEEALHADTALLDQTMPAYTTFYAELASEAWRTFFTDESSAIVTIGADLDNLRSAWRHSLATQDGASTAKLVPSLWALYEIRGWHQAGVALFGEALNSYAATPDESAGQVSRALSAAVQGWFLSHLGQASVAAEQTRTAIATLEVQPNRTALLFAIVSRCAAMTHLSRWEELRSVATAGIRVADEVGDEWWATEMSVWSGFADLGEMKLDSAAAIFDRADAVYRRLGEHRARSWNLLGIGMIALAQGRHNDAVAVLEHMVGLAKAIGYRRAIQTGLQYLGDAHVAAGQPEAAHEVFLEGLAMAQEMGQVLEMAGVLIRIAETRAATGMSNEAVAILSSVVADPASQRSLLAESVAVGEVARQRLEQLMGELDRATLSGVGGAGAATSIEVMTKDILAVAQ